MKRVKKILLAVLLLMLLSQAPFAYRRYRLGRLNATIQVINSEISALANVRTARGNADSQHHGKGVIHVHSYLGGHSSGQFQEIISAAQANDLQFVVMTEHTESLLDTSAKTLKGNHAGVLFLNGNEVDSKEGDRILSIPGDKSLGVPEKLSTNEVVTSSRTRGAVSIVAYPEEFKNWNEPTDGIEIYNVFSNARQINPVVAFFDALWSRGRYPDLVFANYLERPNASLKKWDEVLSTRKSSGLAGNDSHSNVGFSIKGTSGEELIGIKLDPYEVSFRLVRVHVLLPNSELSEETLLDALRKGHCFIGFDLLGDTSKFRFDAISNQESKIQGDEIQLSGETKLNITLPVTSRLVVFRNGAVLLDENGVTEKQLVVTERGVYRVEVYLPQLGKPFQDAPWIISNPIYVR